MVKKKHLMFLLISTMFTLSSCDKDKRNLDWLMEEHDGNLKELIGNDVKILYFREYVYVTSEKLNFEYGYIFMDRASYEKSYQKGENINFKKQKYDNSLIISQGKILNEEFKTISTFISEFYNNKNDYIPYLINTESVEIHFKYYKKNMFGNFKDSII